MSTKTANPKKPTNKLLAERGQLELKRKNASSEASNYRRAIARIDEEIAEYVAFAEPKKRLCRMLNRVFDFTKKKKQIKWKDEFIARLGPDAASEIESKAETTEHLRIRLAKEVE